LIEDAFTGPSGSYNLRPKTPTLQDPLHMLSLLRLDYENRHV